LFPEAGSLHKAPARYFVLRNENECQLGQSGDCPTFSHTIYTDDESV